MGGAVLLGSALATPQLRRRPSDVFIDDAQVIGAGADLVLVCQADRPVRWQLPVLPVGPQKNIKKNTVKLTKN